jgi:hypothetical protein
MPTVFRLIFDAHFMRELSAAEQSTGDSPQARGLNRRLVGTATFERRIGTNQGRGCVQPGMDGVEGEAIRAQGLLGSGRGGSSLSP